MLISTMIVSDESGVLNVVWYNNRYVKNQFKTGDKYVLYGKVTKNRGKLEMVNPVCEQEGKERFTGKIVPLYPLTSGLTQKILQSTMELAIKEVGRMEEYIPSDIREKYHIAELNFAMKNIHFPLCLLYRQNLYVYERFTCLCPAIRHGMGKQGEEPATY